MFVNSDINIFKSLKLEELGNYYILAGDLNAKHKNWRNSEENQRGKWLNAWLLDNAILYKTQLYQRLYNTKMSHVEQNENKFVLTKKPLSRTLKCKVYKTYMRAQYIQINILFIK